MPAHTGSMLRSACATSAIATDLYCSTSAMVWAALAARGACTTAPPRLPRRTEMSPSVSRIRSASRNEGLLMPNSASKSSWRGRESPSRSSPVAMRWRRSDATISANRGW